MNSIAKVEIIQEYQNDLDQNIETEYFFAISPQSAFSELEIQVNEKNIKGIIKEKETAKKEYIEAIQQGKTAVFAEIVEELHDIMKLNIGNIAPHKSANVRIVYLEPLEIALNKFWKFSLGNTFSSRSLGNSQASENLQKACNPDTISASNPNAYTFDISVSIDSPSEITFLQSPSHDISIDYSPDFKKAEIKLDQSHQQFPNKEFILLYRNKNINKPQVTLNKAMDGQYAAMITFFPDFNIYSEEEVYKNFKQKFNANLFLNNENDQNNNKNVDINEFQFDNNKIRGEYIFIIDRSGSMNGDRIVMTRDVLQKLIKMLPNDSYFNIISFGSSYEKMFQQSVKKSDNSVQIAIENVQKFEADMGGTEIYGPMNDAFSQNNIEGYPKNIFLITDGQVHNEDQIVKLVRQNSQKQNTRVYAIGIGNGVSKNLIKSVAEEGMGKQEIIAETSKLEERLQFLLKDSITPFLSSFSLNYDKESVKIIAPSIKSIKSIRKNEALQLYLFLDSDFVSTEVVLKCYDSSQDELKEFTIKIDKSMAQKNIFNHKLGIHKVIKQMLNNLLYNDSPFHDFEINQNSNQNYYQMIKKLSIQYQVLSELTAFILVDETQSQETLPTKVNIPVVQSVDQEQQKFGSAQMQFQATASAGAAPQMYFSYQAQPMEAMVNRESVARGRVKKIQYKSISRNPQNIVSKSQAQQDGSEGIIENQSLEINFQEYDKNIYQDIDSSSTVQDAHQIGTPPQNKDLNTLKLQASSSKLEINLIFLLLIMCFLHFF